MSAQGRGGYVPLSIVEDTALEHTVQRFLDSPVSTFPFFVGALLSLVIHLIGVIFCIFVLEGARTNDLVPQQVFTVTLEGGEKLGGVSRVPDADSKKGKSLPLATDDDVDDSRETASTKKEETKLMQPSAVDDPEEELKKRQAEEARLLALEEKKKKEAAEREKKKAEDKKKKEDEAKKKKEEEQKKKEEEEKKKKEEDAKKKEEEANKKKTEDDKKKREKDLTARQNRDALLDKAVSKAQRYTGESANAGGDGFGAAALGGKGMGGGTLASAEYIAYYNALERHVKEGWRWLPTPEVLTAQITVSILPDGTVQNAVISRGSGNSSFDDSVLRAVYKASPVPRAPETLYPQFREVKFTFDSRR